MNTSAMEGYKSQSGAFIKTALKCSCASCPCSGLLQGGSCGTQDRRLCTSLSPSWHPRLWAWATEQGKSLSPCAQEAFGFPLPGSSCPQDEARGWVPLEMLLVTATMAIFKHRTIKMFTPVTCNLHDTADYGQYLYLNLEAEGRQTRLIIFYLLHSCHSFHKHMKFHASVPATHLLV